MVKEFVEFLKRGNVIDLAVAVILGTAFNAIVQSLVNDLLMPLIGIIIGGVDFSALVLQVGSAQLAYGKFIQAIIYFLLVALALFFVLKAYNRFRVKEEIKEIAAPVKSDEVVVLEQIRELLRAERGPRPNL